MAGRDRENAGRRGHPGALALAIARGNQSSMWRWRSMQAGRDNTVVGATAADLATETYLTASDVTSALSILERPGMVSPRPGPGGSTTYLLLIPRRRRPDTCETDRDRPGYSVQKGWPPCPCSRFTAGTGGSPSVLRRLLGVFGLGLEDVEVSADVAL